MAKRRKRETVVGPKGFGTEIAGPVNKTAERYVKGMKKGFKRWQKLYGNRAKSVMYATANKMATKEQVKMGPTYNQLMELWGNEKLR